MLKDLFSRAYFTLCATSEMLAKMALTVRPMLMEALVLSLPGEDIRKTRKPFSLGRIV